MNNEQITDMIENQMDSIYQRCQEFYQAGDEETGFALYQEYREWVEVEESEDEESGYVLMTMPCWIN